MTVEIAVPVSVLARLDPAEHPRWAGVLSELRQELVDLERGAVDDPDAGVDPRRRFATAAQQRAVQVRDRMCVAPGCHAPAFSAQIDHTVEHARHGPTHTTNLGPLCPFHHLLKTSLGWRLTQLEPGWFRWTSPTGATYDVHPEPVLVELPTPRPRLDGRPRRVPEPDLLHPDDDGDVRGEVTSIWDHNLDPDHARRPGHHPYLYPDDPPF